MDCHEKNGCPPNTHNLHCGYPDCTKGRAEKTARPVARPLEERVAALEAVSHPPMDLTKLATHLAETVAKILEVDPHQFSSRPCQTCSAVSATVGRSFGCVRRAERSRSPA